MQETRAELEKQIIKMIANVIELQQENLNVNSKLSDLQIDSIDLFEIINNIEEAYNISITGYEISRIETIQDIINYVEGIY